MGANSSDDHEQQLVECLNADNIIDQQQQQQQQQQQFQQHVVNSSSIIIRFKCSFCDRGFSNAQALGGHMNVHRRDRAAKFNASTSSSDTTHHHQYHNQSQLLPWNISSSIQADHKEYCQDQEKQEDADNIHVRQQYHNPQQQLPLFVDTVVPEEGENNDPKEDHEVTITKRQLIMHQSSSSSHGHDHLANNDDMELDLELRLGPDPEDGNRYHVHN